MTPSGVEVLEAPEMARCSVELLFDLERDPDNRQLLRIAPGVRYRLSGLDPANAHLVLLHRVP
ncbi:hypothetical protein [Pseudonocardia sp. T1-2H]|uniref:hypothetical protein n=1 Tax=Pseudonocardia sp. T1-2H TaxID=3128899 RepID=UPI0031019F24